MTPLEYRIEQARNLNTSPDILTVLASDKSELVSKAAKQSLELLTYRDLGVRNNL